MSLPDADNLSVIITPDGRIGFIWDDRLSVLGEEGSMQIRRASHVEPTAAGLWIADLAPSNGPKLGPFKLRDVALAAEREWLQEHGGM